MSIKVYFLCLCLFKESAKQRNQNHKEWAAIKELDKSVSVRSRCTDVQGIRDFTFIVSFIVFFSFRKFFGTQLRYIEEKAFYNLTQMEDL